MTNKQKCYHYPKEKFSFVFVAVSHTTFFIKIIPFNYLIGTFIHPTKQWILTNPIC